MNQECIKELLDYDAATGSFIWRVTPGRRRKAGDPAGSRSPDGYYSVVIRGKRYKHHRLAWLYVHGAWPNGLIDHINGDKGDNRIANLRVATDTQNHANSGPFKNNKSGAKGVHWHVRDRVWVARIRHLGTEHHLGCFSKFDDAIAARREAAMKLHGEFYRA